jgi:hypothetical protein
MSAELPQETLAVFVQRRQRPNPELIRPRDVMGIGDRSRERVRVLLGQPSGAID